MKDQVGVERGESRSNIINAVKDPLSFFALALLVVEALFALAFGLTTGLDRTIFIIVNSIIILVLIVVVAILALRTKPSENKTEIAQSQSLTPNKEKDIKGEYCAANDLKYKVTVTRLTGDYYKVNNPDWEGVGFFDGQFYYGVFKMNDRATPADRRGNWGAHRNELRKESFEVLGIELKENLIYDQFHEVHGWIKQTG